MDRKSSCAPRIFPIRAVDDIGAATMAGPILLVVNVLPTPPSPPTGLAAYGVSADRINLFWTDTATNETGFTIECKTGPGGTYAPVAAVGANVTSHSHTGLAAGTQYYYRVYATNGVGGSGTSNEAEVATRPALLPPVLASPGNQMLAGGARLYLTNQAHDPNAHPLRLRFSLPDAPRTRADLRHHILGQMMG